jgi:hypothetical protein
MGRRELITLVSGAAAWPFAASAQKSPRPWRIGFLAAGERPANFEGTVWGAFLRGYVTSLAHPTGNVTGLAGLESE